MLDEDLVSKDRKRAKKGHLGSQFQAPIIELSMCYVRTKTYRNGHDFGA